MVLVSSLFGPNQSVLARTLGKTPLVNRAS